MGKWNYFSSLGIIFLFSPILSLIYYAVSDNPSDPSFLSEFISLFGPALILQILAGLILLILGLVIMKKKEKPKVNKTKMKFICPNCELAYKSGLKECPDCGTKF